MANQFIQVHPDTPGLGKKIDLEELVVDGQVVERQRVQLAGKNPSEVADVRNGTPGAADYGIVVRLAGDVFAGRVPIAPRYAENASVAGSVETTILTYVVPALTTVRLAGLHMSGSAAYKFRVKLNGAAFLTARSTASNINAKAEFGDGAPVLVAGDVVTVTAHHEEVAAQTCEVTLYGWSD